MPKIPTSELLQRPLHCPLRRRVLNMTRSNMPPVKVPANLPELVRTTFNKAKANGDVNFYPTQVALLNTRPFPFQLRFSPSLANKPKPPPSSDDKSPKKPFNPFENPPPALTIGTIEPSHILVLNKFAIVPEHFLLITREFKQQTHLLDAQDLAAAYACIRAYHEYRTEGREREELFAFFNCGQHSGASQPHRHLQLLPIAKMRDGLEGGEWNVLADKLIEPGTGLGEKKIPFATFGENIRENMEPQELRATYLRLYRRACAAVGAGDGPSEEELASKPDGVETAISYNMAITRNAMVISPRVAEGSVVVDKEGQEVGKLALNGTVLAGTALVKSQPEWDALRTDPNQLCDILGKIGVRASL